MGENLEGNCAVSNLNQILLNYKELEFNFVKKGGKEKCRHCFDLKLFHRRRFFVDIFLASK